MDLELVLPEPASRAARTSYFNTRLQFSLGSIILGIIVSDIDREKKVSLLK